MSGSVWAIPVTMVRNEELVIRAILKPLVEVFPLVVVGDTGSTDRTVEICKEYPKVRVVEYGPLTMDKVGKVRQWLAGYVKNAGYQYAWMVDGDELYYPEAMEFILRHGPSDEMTMGFSQLVSVDLDSEGNFWRMDDVYSRTAIWHVDDKWNGDYPFESPACMAEDGSRWKYYPIDKPEERNWHGYHLHRLARSPKDGEVYLRVQKQYQFCMADMESVHRVEKVDLSWWGL